MDSKKLRLSYEGFRVFVFFDVEKSE